MRMYNLSIRYPMPLFQREIINKNTEIVLWQITESETQLQEGLLLSEQALQRLSLRKSENHRKGYLAIRQLLKTLGIPPHIHQYSNIGAPYLVDGRHISISHTKDIAAVAISSTSVGIDIEYYKEKIKKIASRFLHPSEYRSPESENEIEYLTQIWTAKEALYKLSHKPGLIFKEQMCIEPFEKEDTEGLGMVIENLTLAIER
jgi:4'-phosphopantetheinyl transferase